MRVLVGRGGQLVAPMGPVRSGGDPDCGCATLATLDNGHPVDTATVIDRPDITTADIVAAMLALLDRLGWGTGEDAREVASATVDDIADIADDYPVGTCLRASYSHRTESWLFTPDSDI